MATVQPPPKPAPASKYDAFVESRLAKARGRIRTLDVAVALLGFVAITLGFALVMAVVDRSLELAPLFRQLAFGGYLLGSALYLTFALILPLSRRLNPYYAARQMEQVIPGAKNSVVNWLDLRERKLPAAIQGAVGQRAARDLAQADLEQAISSRRAAWLGGLTTALLVGLFIALMVFGARPFASLLGRAFAPFVETSIATRTQLNLLRPQGGDVTISVGQSVVFAVEVNGRVPEPNHPDALKLLFRYQPDDSYEERLLQRDSGREWSTVLPAFQVQNGLWYKITGGDAETPEYRIQVRSVPLVEGWNVAYHYRPYVGWRDDISRDPNLKALRGTAVTLTAHTNRTVKIADSRIDLEGNGGKRPLRAEAVPDDPQGLRFSFVLDEDGKYRLWFTSTDGEQNTDPMPYTIQVFRDRAPEVDLTKPGKDISLPANGTLQLEGAASDDIGVTSIALRMSVDKGPALAAKPYREGKSFKLEDGGYPKMLHYKDFVALDKVKDALGQPFALQPGMVIDYWLEAADNCDYFEPNIGRTKKHYKVTITPADPDKKKEEKQRQQAEKDQKQHEAKQDQDLKKENEERKEAANANQQPDNKEQKPGDAKEQKPGDKEQKPGDQPQKPDNAKEQKPGDKQEGADKKPGDKQEKPGDAKEQKPGDKQEGADKKPGDKQEGADKPKEGDKGGENKPNGDPKQEEKVKKDADKLNDAVKKQEQKEKGEAKDEPKEKPGEQKEGPKQEPREQNKGEGKDSKGNKEGNGQGKGAGAQSGGQKPDAAQGKNNGQGGDKQDKGDSKPEPKPGADAGKHKDEGQNEQPDNDKAGGGKGIGQPDPKQPPAQSKPDDEDRELRHEPNGAAKNDGPKSDPKPKGDPKDEPKTLTRNKDKGEGKQGEGSENKGGAKSGGDPKAGGEAKKGEEKQTGEDQQKESGQAKGDKEEETKENVDRLSKKARSKDDKEREDAERKLDQLSKKAKDPEVRDAARKAMDEEARDRKEQESKPASAKDAPKDQGQPKTQDGKPCAECKGNPNGQNPGNGAGKAAGAGDKKDKGDAKGEGNQTADAKPPMGDKKEPGTGEGQAKGKGDSGENPSARAGGEGPGREEENVAKSPGDKPAEGDADPNHKKKATDLQLEYWKDIKNKLEALKKNPADLDRILKEAGMTKKDFDELSNAVEEKLPAPQQSGSRPTAGVSRSQNIQGKNGDAKASGAGSAPPGFGDAWRNFSRQISEPDKK
jgi:collagen type III alpha